jgi:hypothetical protein
MNISTKVRLRLNDRARHELPVLLNLTGEVPQVGEVINVQVPDRTVRARVTNTSAPLCRGEAITYCVFATEVD